MREPDNQTKVLPISIGSGRSSGTALQLETECTKVKTDYHPISFLLGHRLEKPIHNFRIETDTGVLYALRHV